MLKCVMIILLCIMTLGACGDSKTTTNPLPNQVGEPTIVAQPEGGKATVSGRAINSTTNQPYSTTRIQLAEVYPDDKGGKGFVLSEGQSPNTTTDTQGDFVLASIPPHEYVIVVGDVYGAYKIILDDQQVTRIIDAKADQTIELGEIKTDIQAP